MFNKSIAAVIAVVVLAASAVIPAARAGERGKFRGKAVLVTTSWNEQKVGAKDVGSIAVGHLDGMIFNEKGEGFLDKARYQVFAQVDNGRVWGYKVFTMPDGSQAFAKYENAQIDHSVYKGKISFTGGTGRYENLRGQATYVYTAVADNVAWDILEGEYELP